MPTYTPYHELTRPIPRNTVDRNIWGGQLNETLDEIDHKLTLHGPLAQRPAPAVIGRKYVTTDESPPVLYLDTGATWAAIGANQEALQEHVAATNPHNVTATQTGAVPATGGAFTGNVTLGTTDTGDAELSSGANPGLTIVETTAPTGFTFTGSRTVDVVTRVDVDLTNPNAGPVTEDVTVNLYDGTDNLGVLVSSETKSVTVPASTTSTVGFIAFPTSVDTGSYFIEVTKTGTTLTVPRTAVTTQGSVYTIRQNALGDLEIRDQNNALVLTIDSATNQFHFRANSLAGVDGITSTTLPQDGRFLDLEGGNNDVDLWHVGLSGQYGYYLRYVGSGSSNSNALELWTDNQASDPDTRVYRVLQDGSINYDADLRSGGMGVARVNGHTSPRTIYQQSTEPTGGTAGDIWFEL